MFHTEQLRTISRTVKPLKEAVFHIAFNFIEIQVCFTQEWVINWIGNFKKLGFVEKMYSWELSGKFYKTCVYLNIADWLD